MRRLLALALLLLPLAASAQRASFVRGGRGPIHPAPGLTMPFDGVGAAFAEDANTVSHVTFDGRHNLLLQSEAFDTSPWVAYTTGTPTIGAPGVFPGAVLGPFGDPATRIAFDATINNTQASMMYQNVGALLTGRTYTASLWIQAAQVVQQDVYLQITDFTAGNTGKTLCPAPVNGWIRCSVTHTRTNGNTSYVTLGADSQAYSGQPVQGQRFVHVWGAQLNIDVSSPTTYVATTVAAITSVPLDSKGATWTTTGTPFAVQAARMPTTLATGGATSFSAGSYYTRSGDLNPTQSWWACIAFFGSDTTTNQYPVGDTDGTAGWSFRVTTSSVRLLSWYATTGLVQSIPANASVANGLNVFCGGWSSTAAQQYGKLNLGTMVTNAAVGAALSSASPARIGMPDGVVPFLGTVIDFIFAYGEPSDALFTAQMQRYFGTLGTRGETLTMTRTTPTTVEIGGNVWNVPAGVGAVNASGLLVDRATTNYAINTNDPCATGNVANTGWTFFSTTCAHAAGYAPDTTLTADQFTQTALNGGPYENVVIPSTTTITGSVYGRRVSGSGYVSIMVRCQVGTPSACTCSRNDGGACTPAVAPTGLAASDCTAKALIDSTAWVRLGVNATCTSAGTGMIVAAYPGEVGVTTTDTAYLWGLQGEVGPYASAYCPSGASSCTRNVDVPTFTPPGAINYALQSDAFNTTWSAAGTTVTPDTQPNPIEGFFTADTITALASTAEHGVGQTPVATGVTLNPATWSVYVQAGTYKYVGLRGGLTSKAWFDVQTCTVLGQSAGTTAAATPVPGTSWCRISNTGDFSASSFGNIWFTNASGATLLAMAGTETFYLSRANFTASPAPLDPILTTTTPAAATNNSRGCISLTGAPSPWRTWPTSGNYLFSIGTAAAANALTATSGSFVSYDYSAGNNNVSYAGLSTATHKLNAAFNADWTKPVRARIDGTNYSAGAGSGSGIISGLSTSGYLGVGGGSGTSPFEGYLKRLRFYRNSGCR